MKRGPKAFLLLQFLSFSWWHYIHVGAIKSKQEDRTFTKQYVVFILYVYCKKIFQMSLLSTEK